MTELQSETINLTRSPAVCSVAVGVDTVAAVRVCCRCLDAVCVRMCVCAPQVLGVCGVQGIRSDSVFRNARRDAVHQTLRR